MCSALIRETESGRVQGRALRVGPDVALAWLGLPYAARAAGLLRFAPPAPPPTWAGVRPATRFAPDTLQPLDPSVTLQPSVEGSLALNVWAPSTPGPHPVLVWFHGGAFRAGSGRLYDGRVFAARRNVVVVSVNSRLGPLGYADFAGLFGDERFAVNAGYLDQRAALAWVHRNVAAFGGDPGRITVAGESAGAVTVNLLLRDPAAQPLLAGAAVQSGGVNQLSDRENSVDLAAAYARALGVTAATRDRLWTLPPAAFVRSLHTLERVRARRLNSRPTLDGTVLPGSVTDLLARPAAAVPLLVGANREEYSLFVKLPDRVFPRTDRALLAGVLTDAAGGGRAAAVLDAYPDSPDGLVALGTDLFFHAPNDALLRAHRADSFRYRFDWGTRLFDLRAAHGMELLFLWPRPMGLSSGALRGRGRAEQAHLAEQMQAAWASFVRAGHPGANWAPWSAARPQLTRLDLDGLTVTAQGEGARMTRWAGLLPPMP
ncbi:carboxylesterase family protein [Deinococcus radiotolerans]|uniref:Carboxylic ester hydrolase n=1 Tax=Deinococcus radiotolerans TaxID=1309407 RepID=A0ABQ2FHR7_9DEIO|nr:carboxylesterase family protein [Deinococcus radiotolerans]GGK88654.1 para-nitrobenzyl esterase [Deinococcus radiotolerans]